MAEGSNGIQAVVFERIFQVIAEIGIVVQDGKVDETVRGCGFRSLFGAGFHCQAGPPVRRFVGSVTSRHAPPSGRFNAVIAPPCWFTMPSATVKPKPVPLASRRLDTNASKMSGSTSAGMPGPSSSTVTEVQDCALRCNSLEFTAILPDGRIA